MVTRPTLAPCLMVQGTASGAGKSLLVTALCRIFARAGVRVSPFKAQNMSLNAAVTADGGEIGRAQAAQAEAAGSEPTTDVNPILLKPESETRAQLIVQGRARASVTWDEYVRLRPTLLPVIEASLATLRLAHDLVVIEGAGSPAEINLRHADLVNMTVARLADARVLLVGDIDRGGVFAALVGTLALLEPEDRAHVAGLVINKLRGDAGVLAPGLSELSARTGLPVLGVIPWLTETLVPAEDSLDLDTFSTPAAPGALAIRVPRLPRVSNFDDVEPLAREPGVDVRFVRSPAGLADADLIILPGSKGTMADLAWLRGRGLASAIVAHARDGRPVLGICGGYQMLGSSLRDPERVESAETEAPGLGLLAAETTFGLEKTTLRVRARVTPGAGFLAAAAGSELTAYEIHAGETRVTEPATRPFTVVRRGDRAVEDAEGAANPAGVVVGTYLHGLLADDALRRALLVAVARGRGTDPDSRWGTPAPAGERYDRLANAVEGALDMRAIGALVGLAPRGR
jgi:adenosylcobyric acid synthase